MFSLILRKIFGSKNERYVKQKARVVAAIGALEPELQKLSDADFPARIAAYKERVIAGEATLDDL